MRRRLLPIIVIALALTPLSCEQLPNLAPTAAFIYSPVSPIFAGQTTVTFNANSSLDPDGRVATYTWDFGDGTAEQTRSEPTVTHVFPDTAARCVEITYSVLLTVVDDKDGRSTASQTVKVVELPAPGSSACVALGM